MSEKKISVLATEWQTGLATSLIDISTAEKFIIEAAVEYQAWGFLKVDKLSIDDDSQIEHSKSPINADTELTVSEWGVIKVLAGLFAERENALIQESSRVASHEPYGRSSSEVEQDIQNFRNEHFRRQVFCLPVTTI